MRLQRAENELDGSSIPSHVTELGVDIFESKNLDYPTFHFQHSTFYKVRLAHLELYL